MKMRTLVSTLLNETFSLNKIISQDKLMDMLSLLFNLEETSEFTT
jgi:hypothetical protein